MKRKVLIAGLMAATMMAITACSSKETTTEPTTVTVETTVPETTTTAETTIQAETIVQAETTEPASKELALLREFAEEVQDAVEAKDISWIADLCEYPVYVKLAGEEGSEVEAHEDIIAFGEEKIFTEELVSVIGELDTAALEEAEAGVVMGDKVNITIGIVNDAPAITGINL